MTLRLKGSNSGDVSIKAPATAGNNTFTLPTSNGSAEQFLKNSGTAGELEFSSMVEDSSGRLLVGHSSSRDVANVAQPKIQIEGTNVSTSTLSVIRNSNDTGGPVLALSKTRGTSTGSSTVVQSGDTAGAIYFSGADGTDVNSYAAWIEAEIDGTPGGNDMPGRLVFSTTADGANSPSERVRLDSEGRLGVGCTPTNFGANFNAIEIHSASGTNTYLALTNSTTGGDGSNHGFNLIASGDNATLLLRESGFINFSTNDTERMRLTDGGDLRIGTTANNGNGKIEVLFDTSRNGINLKASNATLNQNYLIFQNSAGSTTGRIQQTGTTATSYLSGSDYRLKENIVDLDGAIARVKELAPKRFNFIGETDRTVDGFLAHEAQAVVPEAVSGTHNGVEVWKEGQELPEGVSVGDNKLDEDGNTIPDYQGIDQSKMVPLLTAALQEAISKIETLETQNTAQQTQIDDLLARVTALEAA